MLIFLKAIMKLFIPIFVYLFMSQSYSDEFSSLHGMTLKIERNALCLPESYSATCLDDCHENFYSPYELMAPKHQKKKVEFLNQSVFFANDIFYDLWTKKGLSYKGFVQILVQLKIDGVCYSGKSLNLLDELKAMTPSTEDLDHIVLTEEEYVGFKKVFYFDKQEFRRNSNLSNFLIR